MRLFSRAVTLVCVMAFAIAAAAQQTTVTGTISAYANGTYSVRAFGHAPASAAISGTGGISIPLDSSTVWNFSVTGPSGSQLQGFNVNVNVGSAASQDITAILVNAAPVPPSGVPGFIGGFNYMWPVNPKVSGCLTNDATGTLSWATCGSGGGGALFPATNGTVCNTSTTASTTCGSGSTFAGKAATAGTADNANAGPGGVAFAPSATTDTTNANNVTKGTLPPPQLPAGYYNGVTAKTAGFVCVGNSYQYGIGATFLGNGHCEIMANDSPKVVGFEPVLVGVGGTTAAVIAQSIYTSLPVNASLPYTLYSGWVENDAAYDTCSKVAASTCISNFKQSVLGGLARSAFPSTFITANLATVTNYGPDFNFPLGTIGNGGSARQSLASAGTLVFTIPATNNGHIGIVKGTTNGGTGTFSVAIGPSGNQVQQVNSCYGSGTTTFSSGPCGGTALPNATRGPQAEEFYNAAWAGQAVTITVTATNATASTIIGAYYSTTTPAPNLNLNIVSNGNVATYDTTGVYNAALSSVVSSLSTDGAHAVYFDANSIEVAVGYADSKVSGHPGDKAHLALAIGAEAATVAAGYPWAFPGSGGQSVANFGNFWRGLNVQHTTYSGSTPQSVVWSHLNALNNNAGGFVLYDTPTTSAAMGMHIQNGTLPDGTTGNYESMFTTSTSFQLCPFETASYTAYAEVTSTPDGCWNPSTKVFTIKGAVKAAQFIATGTYASTIGTAIASAATISPVTPIVHITGTAAISTITPPTGCTTAGTSCHIVLIPDAAFVTTNTGNIAIASTAVVGRPLAFDYDPATAKMYPSY